MKKRKPQLGFADVDPAWQRVMIPAHVIVIETAGKSIEQIVSEMIRVPVEKSMVLDFTIGHVSGSPIPPDLDEERIELIRLQRMLNFRHRNQRFDWLGDGLLQRAIRESIRTRSWDPFK